MPTPSELKDGLRGALGDPTLEPEIFVRPLREQGLVTKGGRGLYAPQMTPRDCARALIAIMSYRPAAQAVKTVRTYSALTHDARRAKRLARPDFMEDPTIWGWDGLSRVAWLEDVVCALIMFGADGTLKRELPLRRKDADPRLMLRLYGPYPSASLEVWPAKGSEGKRWRRDYRDHLASEIFPPAPNPSTFARVSEIYENTFVALGELFAAEKERRRPEETEGSRRSKLARNRKTADQSDPRGQTRSARTADVGPDRRSKSRPKRRGGKSV